MLMMRNRKGKFEDVSQHCGPALQRFRVASRGVAFGDLDNDGFSISPSVA